MADWIRVKVWKVDVEDHEEQLGLEPKDEPKAVPQWVNIAKAITFYDKGGSDQYDPECNIDFGNGMVISVQASESKLIAALSSTDRFIIIH